MTMNKVVAIILNYNTAEDSKKCALLLREQQGCNLDVVIVDNASKKEQIIELEKFCNTNSITLIKNKVNAGFSAGNNTGLKYASKVDAKYGLIINPDVEVRDKYYIKRCIDKMESDNKIAVLGSDVINMQGKHQNPMREVRYLEEIFWPFEIISNKFRKSLPYVGDYMKSSYCEKVSGCCFFIKIKFAEQMGYFDENVFLYCEEPILAATVKRMDMKEYYLHDAKAYHMHKSSEKGNPRKRLNLFYKSRKYYLEKYSNYKGIFLKIILMSRKVQNIVLTSKK